MVTEVPRTCISYSVLNWHLWQTVLMSSLPTLSSTVKKHMPQIYLFCSYLYISVAGMGEPTNFKGNFRIPPPSSSKGSSVDVHISCLLEIHIMLKKCISSNFFVVHVANLNEIIIMLLLFSVRENPSRRVISNHPLTTPSKARAKFSYICSSA